MYDDTVATISLSADEVDIIKLALEKYQDTVVSIGEELTINELLKKIN